MSPNPFKYIDIEPHEPPINGPWLPLVNLKLISTVYAPLPNAIPGLICRALFPGKFAAPGMKYPAGQACAENTEKQFVKLK